MSEYKFIPVDEPLQIVLQKGDSIRSIVKEDLETYLYDFVLMHSSIDDMYNGSRNYKDALEWILINLFRTVRIQLYIDGEIRLYVVREIQNGNNEVIQLYNKSKLCVFLSDSKVLDRRFDKLLYDELNRILEEGI